ncbi:hypothetical protein DPMN_052189 [Dreissena polymorpha]|uniref:Uncharacterized protein n=1 Tax=Dreissena polymorpha TaxID=45954 RepID=A0A9D4HR12_DREPO|nr:hypothetical protein DPMN_052189 [Dreissena polymorpha]
MRASDIEYSTFDKVASLHQLAHNPNDNMDPQKANQSIKKGKGDVEEKMLQKNVLKEASTRLIQRGQFRLLQNMMKLALRKRK